MHPDRHLTAIPDYLNHQYNEFRKMFLVLLVLFLLFVLSGCSNVTAPSSSDKEDSMPIIGLSHGMGITFTRSFDGSALSIMYDKAQINYGADGVMPSNGKLHFEAGFTLITGKTELPLRFFLRGFHKAPESNPVKLSFSIADTILNQHVLPNEGNYVICIDAILKEKENNIAWKAELAQQAGESGSFTIDTIDIAVIDKNAVSETQVECS